MSLFLEKYSVLLLCHVSGNVENDNYKTSL